jgi:hypothetical protein
MHNLKFVRVFWVLAIIAGASVPPALAQSAPGVCTQPNEHCIAVKIGNDVSGALKISVDVSELRVTGTNHVIFWRIDNTAAQKYRFPANGIAFKSATGKQEFQCGTLGDSGLVFQCTDPNQTKGRFEYAVTVSGSPAVPVLDPWVINE